VRSDLTAFEPPVILERPALWSRVLVWLIVGVTTTGVAWAAFAKIEESVPATGKLEPLTSVLEVKAPDGGVVREVLVEDGQRVQKGQLLLTFDPTAPEADVESLTRLRNALVQENQFYSGPGTGSSELQSLLKLRNTLTQENQFYSTGSGDLNLQSLLKLRETLAQENDFYRAQINGSTASGRGGEFSANQQRLLAASRAEYQSRVAAAQLQIRELEKQRSQVQGQLVSAQEILTLNQEILGRIQPVVQEGALSQLQYQRQQQEVLTKQSEVDRLTSEAQRLTVAIAEAREQLQNTIALSNKDILAKIADNQKRIAEIDTQLSRTQLDNQKRIAEIDTQFSGTRLENQKRITEIDGQLAKAKLARTYQELRAPQDGVVFDLQPRSPGFVASATEPILKIVPGSKLVASIFITNQDIGFVKTGMPVDVKVESFPESEFGSLPGKLIWIGSDALPPTEVRPFYAFPAKVELERQTLEANGKPLLLQSGMAVNASVKVRKRTVLSLFTNLFEKKIKSLESVR